jgi:hypothetical protein
MTIGPRLAALVAGISLSACGGGSAPEPAAPAPAGEEGGDGLEGAGEAAPAPPEVSTEPAGEAPDPAQVQAELLAAEKAAFELAEPVFRQHCARCHVKGAKKASRKTLDHFDMTSYPFGGDHAHEITHEIREVLAIGGGKATMPEDRPGAVQGDELSLIAAWAEAHDKAEAGRAHEGRGDGAGHDHSSGHKH